MVEVFAIKIIEEQKYLKFREKLLSLLPKIQVLKIQRFKRIADEQRSLLGEVLSRQILSKKTGIKITDLEIIKSDKGKPNVKMQDGCFL